MSDPAQKAVGIDIGGTKMAVAAVDGTGRICAQTELPTEAELGFERAVSRLAGAVKLVLADAGWRAGDLRGVGIGCAGPVDPPRGIINNPYTLTGWNQCDIVTPLRSRFDTEVRLENDADVAALGECFAGAGKGFEPVVMLTFGTGIGGAAIVRGAIYRGANGEHPEFGHIPVRVGGEECYCGIAGCFESQASGTAIGEAGKTLGFPDAPAVFRSAGQGDVAALMILDRALKAAGTAAWILCHTLLPQRLILGGGMMEEHYEMFAAAMNIRLETATQFTRAGVSIARAALGNDAGVVGAAALMLG